MVELEADCEPRSRNARAWLAIRLGDAPGEFPTYKQRVNLTSTVLIYADSIPKMSEAPPALDPVKLRCWRNVGISNG